MEEPSRKCLFCLGPADINIESTQPVTDKVIALANSWFKGFPEFPRKVLVDGMKQACYCSPCHKKIEEVHSIHENLREIQYQLNSLITTLETDVIEHYKVYKEEETDTMADSSKVMDLRMKFYKLGLRKSLETTTACENITISPAIYGYTEPDDLDLGESQEASPHAATAEDDDDLWTPDSLELHWSPKYKSKLRRPNTRSSTRKNASVSNQDDVTESEVEDVKPLKLLRRAKSLIQKRFRVGNKILKKSGRKRRSGKPRNHDEDVKEESETGNEVDKKSRLRRAIEGKRRLRCTHSGCDKTFRFENTRFAHIRYDHEGIKKPFPCDECDSSFITSSALTQHRKSHKNPKPSKNSEAAPFPCTVEGCTKAFQLEAIRFVHVKKVHEGVNEFKCAHCDKTYTKPCKLRIHERAHTGELPFECTTCHKRFSAKAYLRQHASLHMKKFACQICGKPSTSRQALQFHINTHSAIKPFVCELCGYACTTKQYLEIHQRNQHEGATNLEAIKCDLCGKNLSSKIALENHRISKHKIGKAKFNCEQCPGAFNNQRELRIHVNNVHLNLKKYECMICNKKFSTQANVRTHHERHHMAKEERPRPYQCDTCSKCFYIKKTLENHMAIHSSERPFPCDRCHLRFPSKNYLDLHKYTIHDKRQKKRNSTTDGGEENRDNSSNIKNMVIASEEYHVIGSEEREIHQQHAQSQNEIRNLASHFMLQSDIATFYK